MNQGTTFLRAIEVWVPSADRTLLEFGGGLYGKATRFAALSRASCFGRGEGLPGRAWEEGKPLILKQFEGSYFRRTAAAEAEGIRCGIALPIYAGDFLTSVAVLFCGDAGAHAGAIELWHHDPAVGDDMRLVDGYYGSTAQSFEAASRGTRLGKGSGLPGAAWAAQAPVFVSDLGEGAGFARGEAARQAGLTRGYALPCSIQRNEDYVVTFLSSPETPIARRFEIWTPDAARAHLTLSGGCCEAQGVLEAAPAGPRIERGHGTIGRAFASGVPAVGDHAGGEPAGLGEALGAIGLESVAAFPVIRDGRLQAVAVWYL